MRNPFQIIKGLFDKRERLARFVLGSMGLLDKMVFKKDAVRVLALSDDPQVHLEAKVCAAYVPPAGRQKESYLVSLITIEACMQYWLDWIVNTRKVERRELKRLKEVVIMSLVAHEVRHRVYWKRRIRLFSLETAEVFEDKFFNEALAMVKRQLKSGSFPTYENPEEFDAGVIEMVVLLKGANNKIDLDELVKIVQYEATQV